MPRQPTYDAPAIVWPGDLPGQLRHRFPIWVLSSETPWFQLGFLDACLGLAGGDPFALDLARSLAWWMFQERPLDAKLAARLSVNPGLVPAAAGVAGLTAKPVPPDQAELFEHLDALGDEAMLLEFLRTVLPVPGLGPIWLGRAFALILRLPDPEVGHDLIASCSLGPQAGVLRERLLAEFAFHRPDLAAARAAQAAAERLRGGMFASYGALLEAMLAMRAGEADAAAVLLGPLWRAMPWNVNIACLLASLRRPVLPAAREIEAGDCAILAYTWNKAALIERTLGSLRDSDIGACPVIVLDNGSKDGTGAVLERAKADFAPGRLSIVSLSANVGAPGARNWLLSLPEVKAKRYAAFIDDDVILPRDWLSVLRAEALAYPGAGAVGCRIVDESAPNALQSADFNILPPEMGEPALPEIPERIFMCNNCAGLADPGLFAYARTCLSVSGCCHLVNMEAVRAAGPFDVAFAPTQFDDLERDLRSWLAGFPARFAGALAVRHVQSSSLRQAVNPAQVAHIAGNKIKLEAKFTDEQARRLVAENHQVLWDEYAAAHAGLSETAKTGVWGGEPL